MKTVMSLFSILVICAVVVFIGIDVAQEPDYQLNHTIMLKNGWGYDTDAYIDIGEYLLFHDENSNGIINLPKDQLLMIVDNN